jgi:hypothetical protein
MTVLMTYAGDAAPDSDRTRTGGVPLAPAGFVWPRCRTCDGNMQFVAQLRLGDDDLLAIFMCANDPGLCDEWDASAGGNRALLLPAGGAPVTPPPDGATSLGAVSAVALVAREGDYDAARGAWPGSRREVLGQLGGVPAWIQGDETPACPACHTPMAFVAQLEEGREDATAANFGGGCAYAFACLTDREAAFLWQC